MPAYQTPISESKFWHSLMKDVYGPRKGGAVVFIDAENARRGIAKTSAQAAFGKLLTKTFDYQLEKEDFTLSPQNYIQRAIGAPGREQPSVLGVDEFVGGGAGDKRRSMANQNLLLASIWQMLRKKRVVSLCALPDWNEADVRLRKYADYRLWCREEPIGIVQPYKVTVPFSGRGSQTRVGLKKLSYSPDAAKLTFPNMEAKNDPLYEWLSKQKDEVIQSGNFDADSVLGDNTEEDTELSDKARKEIKREQLTKISIEMYKPWTEHMGLSQEEIALAIEYSDSWVGDRVREWKNGKHRDIVSIPENDPQDALEQSKAT